jgi:hypothetical protein
VTESNTKLTLVFDGECWFCRTWISRFREWTCGEGAAPVSFEPYQSVGGRFSPLGESEFAQAIYLLDSQGKILGRGAEAAFGVLKNAAPERTGVRLLGSMLLGAYRSLGVFRKIADASYAAVARNRRIASKLTEVFWGEHFARPSYAYSRGLWIRGIGLLYLVAFASLSVQITGLVGDEGILPAADFFAQVHEKIPSAVDRWLFFPSLAQWFNSSRSLEVMTWGGALSGLLLAWNRSQWLSRGAAALAFGFYLSLTHAGQEFLSYQWDALLLESGFLTLLLLLAPKPAVLCIGKCAPYDSGFERRFRWVFLALFAKLWFLSGWSKWASGDLSWASGSALLVHFQTQPLPNFASPYFHAFFRAFGGVDAAGASGAKFLNDLLIGVECSAPLLLLAPRRAKVLGFFVFSSIQVLIALSGNFGFFNWLSLLLGIWLLDDRAWRSFPVLNRFPKPRVLTLSLSRHRKNWGTGLGLVAAFAVCVPLVGGKGFSSLEILLSRWGISHRYGLFSVMTQERLEVVFETSTDGRHWEELEFKYKPGGLNRAHPNLLVHLPRLDWQLWFAALGEVEDSPWVGEFAERILQATPEVLNLLEGETRLHLEKNHPRFIRAHLYEYEFERAPEGGTQKWRRKLRAPLWMQPRELPPS